MDGERKKLKSLSPTVEVIERKPVKISLLACGPGIAKMEEPVDLDRGVIRHVYDMRVLEVFVDGERKDDFVFYWYGKDSYSESKVLKLLFGNYQKQGST